MKILAKLIFILTMLTICQPAEGEILIYNKISEGFKADGLEMPDSSDSNYLEFKWNAGEWTSRGYLLLDVEFDSDKQIAGINRATQIDYWKEGQDKYYQRTQLDLNVERIGAGDQVYWILTDINTPQDGQVVVLMISGLAGLNNIGLISDQDYKVIPLTLKGTYLEYLQNIDANSGSIQKKIISVSLRLNTWWTRVAQLYRQDYEKTGGESFIHDPFEWAEGGIDKNGSSYGIIKEWLQRNKYTEIN